MAEKTELEIGENFGLELVRVALLLKNPNASAQDLQNLLNEDRVKDTKCPME